MWLEKEVSLYKSHSDNTGRAATFRDILFTYFCENIEEICKLRKLNEQDPNYKKEKGNSKSKLQAYTPAALLKTKKKGELEIIERSGIMQLDFDYKDIKQYDIEELKQTVFNLPFVAFCGLSCSGLGFYALVLISEPERLEDYARHCFKILNKYGITTDESKGPKPENLRYLSYDKNMLHRENPEPLKIHFKERPQVKNKAANTKTIATYQNPKNGHKTPDNLINKIENLKPGERTKGIQKYAYTLGGYGDEEILKIIQNIIRTRQVFQEKVDFFLKCAEDCFRAGSLKPII